MLRELLLAGQLSKLFQFLSCCPSCILCYIPICCIIYICILYIRSGVFVFVFSMSLSLISLSCLSLLFFLTARLSAGWLLPVRREFLLGTVLNWGFRLLVFHCVMYLQTIVLRKRRYINI